MKNLKQYIGKRFLVKGFNEPRELEIYDFYFSNIRNNAKKLLEIGV